VPVTFAQHPVVLIRQDQVGTVDGAERADVVIVAGGTSQDPCVDVRQGQLHGAGLNSTMSSVATLDHKPPKLTSLS